MIAWLESLPWRVRRLIKLAIIALGAALLTASLSRLAAFDSMAAAIEDRTRASRAPQSQFPDVVVVDVDSTSMIALESQLGAWPYDRGIYALTVDTLRQAGARAILFDVLFSDRRDGDPAFAEALQRTPNVYLAGVAHQLPIARQASFHETLQRLSWDAASVPGPRWSDLLLPHPELLAHAQTGIITVLPDADGVLRRLPLVHRIGDAVLPSMTLVMATDPAAGRRLTREARGVRSGEQLWPIDREGFALINFPRSLDGLTVIPFYELVLAGLGLPDYRHVAEKVRGRIVVVGSSAGVLGDFAYVSGIGRTAGVAALAAGIQSLIEGQVLRPPSGLLTAATVALAVLVPLLGAVQSLSPARVGLFTAFTICGLVAGHLAILDVFDQQTRLLQPMVACILTVLMVALFAFRAQLTKQEQLKIEKLATEEAAGLKNKFLTQVTHELRTPLVAIMGYNQLLAEAPPGDPKRAEYTATVGRSAQQLLGLVNDLLDQAKVAAGQMSIVRAPSALEPLLREVEHLMRPLADRKGLALHVEIEDGTPAWLSLDAVRVRQMLINLAGNAVKFTREGEVRLLVLWRDDQLIVEVRDTGPGISREALGRLFQAFQQADATVASEFGGTGLGLSISAGLAKAMGGDISVRSEPGQGSTFTIRILAPAAEPPETASVAARVASLPAVTEPPAPAAVPPSPAADGTVGRRILLADDNEDTRALSALYLARMGHTVLEAGDGQEALEIGQQQQPDAVLMDMLMPRMDGLSATRALRAGGYAGPIIALTALAAEDDARAILAAGCTAFLTKPITPEALREGLHRHLPVRSVERSEGFE